MWQTLATVAADLRFDPAHCRAHRAWLCQQSGGWTDVVDAIENESRWAEVPLLRYWIGLARQHLGAPELAIRSWLPLCWMDPVLFEANAPTVPNPTIRSAWIAFERASLFDPLAGEHMTAWFPAWLLLRHRGLARLFEHEDVLDAGKATQVFRHLLVLLPLEQRGLTDELIRERRALQRLDERFFRYYMGALR
jgi:hypothetical protein